MLAYYGCSLTVLWCSVVHCLTLSPSTYSSSCKMVCFYGSSYYCQQKGPSLSITPRTTALSLSSARRKFNNNNNNNNNNEENDWQESQPSVEFQEEGGREDLSRRIRPMKKDYYYYYDDDDDDDENDYYDDEEDEDFVMEGDDEEEDYPSLEKEGNYWYNPAGQPVAPPRYTYKNPREVDTYDGDDDYYDDELYDEDDDYTRNYYYTKGEELPPPNTRRRRGKKNISNKRSSSFRNTIRPMEPPKLLQEFYKQFFWYGLDDAEQENTNDNDKMFIGGTRGKFNALDILQQTKATTTGRRRRRTSSSSPRRRGYKTEEDDDYFDSATLSSSSSSSKKPPGLFSTLFTPPNDKLNQQVTSWLDDDEDDYDKEAEDYDPYSYKDRKRTTRKQIQKPPKDKDDDDDDDDNSPTFIDSILQQQDKFAKQYDQQFGLNKKQKPLNTAATKKPTSGINRRRYQQTEWNDIDDEDYYYDDDILNEKVNSTVRDTSTSEAVENSTEEVTPLSTTMSSATTVSAVNNSTDTITWNEEDELLSIGRSNYSWQDRAEAQERIPPAGMGAWGPKGSLGVDARTQVAFNIKQQLQEAIHRRDQSKRILGSSIQVLKECRA